MPFSAMNMRTQRGLGPSELYILIRASFVGCNVQRFSLLVSGAQGLTRDRKEPASIMGYGARASDCIAVRVQPLSSRSSYFTLQAGYGPRSEAVNT